MFIYSCRLQNTGGMDHNIEKMEDETPASTPSDEDISEQTDSFIGVVRERAREFQLTHIQHVYSMLFHLCHFNVMNYCRTSFTELHMVCKSLLQCMAGWTKWASAWAAVLFSCGFTAHTPDDVYSLDWFTWSFLSVYSVANVFCLNSVCRSVGRSESQKSWEMSLWYLCFRCGRKCAILPHI